MSSRHRDREREVGYKDRDRYYSERDRERDWGRESGRYDTRYDSRGSSRTDPKYDSRLDNRHESRHDSRRHDYREPERPREKGRRRSSHSRERTDKDRERSEKDRSRHKSRDRPREQSPADDSSRKRRRTEEDYQQKQQQSEQAREQQKQMTAEEKEAAKQKQREDEQNALDAEMEERRRRVQEWQKKRQEAAEAERKQQEEQAAAAAAEAVEQQNKGWSLEDDDDDYHEQQQGGDEDEVDPLDAFMAGNEAAVAPPAAADGIQQPESQQPQPTDVHMADATDDAAAAAEPPADDEIDPLDAFMAAQVMPEVAKVRWSEPPAPAAAAVVDQGAAAVDEVAAGAIAAANSSRPGSKAAPSSKGRAGSSKTKSKVRRYYGSSESSEDYSDTEDEPSQEEEQDDATWAKNVTAGKLSKGEKLMAVDHSTINYPSFRRNFYIEVPEIKRMDDAEVAALRKELDGIKVRGKNPPKPIRNWTQVGISSKVLDILRKSGCEQPLPIQAQALPIIMSGRDCIGIAKTGSGKTLAFVIPMLRHIKDQPPLANGDGPVALIMAPTRELVQQISKEVKKLGRAVGLTSVAVFGGSGVANQISELKRGTEVVAATPGRLIDLLVSGGGKITNLRRVTYLVMDEADRMFDMGFEPQIMRIVSNIRPDRQTVMFSATFPRSVETLARQVLHDPVEIQVGGRSVVNSDITQSVEIRPESDRFLRLLEILGEWYEKGKIIIFVHTQDKCDNLFRDLLKSGYPCLSLHGGKEQSDRECTIGDFKGAVCNILVATSVAARGLDVRELVLVVNYDVPNHHEDYVHRVGRTGRAGNKGTAITFIGPDEERYAPDLVKALKESKAPIPQDLQALADSFAAKRKAGLVQGHGSGYGGSGFKFDKDEDNKVKAARKSKAKEMGFVDEDEEDKEAKSEEEDDIRPIQLQPTVPAVPTTSAALPAAAAMPTANGLSLPAVSAVPAAAPTDPTVAAMLAAAAAASGAAPVVQTVMPQYLPAQPGQQYPGQAVPQQPQNLVEAARLAAERAAAAVTGQVAPAAAAAANPALAAAQAAAMRAAALAAAFAQGGGPAVAVPAQQQQQRQPGFESELEINDFPQNARWKVTHKGFQAEITELTGAAVTTKGLYIAKGEPPEGERKLYLLIEAPTEAQVRRAKQEIRKVIEEHVEKAMRKDTGAGGRYNIM